MEQAVSEVMSSFSLPIAFGLLQNESYGIQPSPPKIRLPFSDGDTEFAKPVPNPLTLALKEDFTDAEGV